MTNQGTPETTCRHYIISLSQPLLTHFTQYSLNNLLTKHVRWPGVAHSGTPVFHMIFGAFTYGLYQDLRKLHNFHSMSNCDSGTQHSPSQLGCCWHWYGRAHCFWVQECRHCKDRLVFHQHREGVFLRKNSCFEYSVEPHGQILKMRKLYVNSE